MPTHTHTHTQISKKSDKEKHLDRGTRTRRMETGTILRSSGDAASIAPLTIAARASTILKPISRDSWQFIFETSFFFFYKIRRKKERKKNQRIEAASITSCLSAGARAATRAMSAPVSLSQPDTASTRSRPPAPPTRLPPRTTHR